MQPRWPAFLRALSQDLGGAACILTEQWSPDSPPRVRSAGLDPHWVEKFADGAPEAVEEIATRWAHPIGEAVAIASRGTPFGAQVLEANGLRADEASLHVGLARVRHRLAAALSIVPRRRRWPADRALRKLEQLAPWMLHAVQIEHDLASLHDEAAALRAVLDKLELGVFVVDERGTPLYANRSGVELASEEPAARSFGADARDPGRQGALARGLRQLARGAGEADQPCALSQPHPVDGRLLQVLVAPLRAAATGAGDHGAADRAIFVADPDNARPRGAVDLLRSLYGLTPAESRLALELAGDRSVDESAAALGIQSSTARTRLKYIFAKTGTRRQASLVRLILSGPAQLRLSH